jgi:hypothetical protein
MLCTNIELDFIGSRKKKYLDVQSIKDATSAALLTRPSE